MATKKNISFDEVSREFDQRVAGADAARADGLARLSIMRAVKDSRMKRERARLEAKLGPGHPRIVDIDNRLLLNAGMMRDLKLELSRARTEAPQVDKDMWILHGYVRDKTHQPAPNMKVALFDSAGAPISGVDHGCTDTNGYYKIKRKMTGVASLPAFVRVLSKSGAILYCDNFAVTPVAGTIDYREIILSGNELDCVPPIEPQGPPPTPFGPDDPETGTGQTVDTRPWTIRGHVSDGGNVFFAGLKLVMADKAGKPIEAMGTRITNEKGEYEFIHPPGPFAALINPPVDLFVQLLDANQKVWGISPPLRFEPGKTQNVNFTVTPPKEGFAKTPN